MTDENIKVIVEALSENFQNKKREYECALSQIQNICPHNHLDDVDRMTGARKCLACGKLIR